ncbi:MAG: pseudouridylate synthase [Alphaproteobacteria bacterium]|nr:pseudouridylate synthase [Alphaproteobacteria bacterium]
MRHGRVHPGHHRTPRLQVLVRTEAWAVVAKPSGIAAHRSDLVRERDTLADRARHRFRAPVSLVHRLDRPVSGCLLLAFDADTARRLGAAMRGPDAHKTYVAMVRGTFRWDDPVTVTTEVANSQGTKGPAHSIVRVLGRSRDPRCSLVAVHPTTGRYHQVRRHLRDLGHPVLGDTSHGDSRENQDWRARGLSRLALHCLALDVPVDAGSDVHACCPIPRALAGLWRTMPWWDEACAAEPRLALPPMALEASDLTDG